MTTDPIVPAPACAQCGLAIPSDTPLGLCPRCVLADAASVAESRPPSPSAAPHPPELASVQTAFPQLEILELIGHGGMGVVYKARQPKLDREVALKLLPTSAEQDPAFAERFHREARLLARLHHANIVTVFDFGEAGNFFYLLMEFVDGVNLRQAMQAGRFSPAEALALVPQICAALQYAHEEGILHRDIKPENILLDARGRVKIADFGIAKLIGESAAHFTLTASGARLGTPTYMAPEQIEKPAQVDHRADIYSLGVVFYELLTGELPIGRFAAPSEKTPLDQRVDHIVFRALAKERELRQQSAQEMQKQVETVAHSPQVPSSGQPVPNTHSTAKPAKETTPNPTDLSPNSLKSWKSTLALSAGILASIASIVFFISVRQPVGVFAAAALLATALSRAIPRNPVHRFLSLAAPGFLLLALLTLTANAWPLQPKRTPAFGLGILWIFLLAATVITHRTLKTSPVFALAHSASSPQSRLWGRALFLVAFALNALLILIPKLEVSQQPVHFGQSTPTVRDPASISPAAHPPTLTEAPYGTSVAHVELHGIHSDPAQFQLTLWSNGAPAALPQSSLTFDPTSSHQPNLPHNPVTVLTTWWLRRGLQNGAWEIAHATPVGAPARVDAFTLPDNIELAPVPNVVSAHLEPGDRLRRWLFLEPSVAQSLQNGPPTEKPKWGISVEILSHPTPSPQSDGLPSPNSFAATETNSPSADLQVQFVNVETNRVFLLGKVRRLPDGFGVFATLTSPDSLESIHMTDLAKRSSSPHDLELQIAWRLPNQWTDPNQSLANLESKISRTLQRLTPQHPWTVFSLQEGDHTLIAQLHLRRIPPQNPNAPSGLSAEIRPQLATNSVSDHQPHLILIYETTLPPDIEVQPRFLSTDGGAYDSESRASLFIDASRIRRVHSATWTLPTSFQGSAVASGLAQLESWTRRSPHSLPSVGTPLTVFSATNAEGKVVQGFFEVRKRQPIPSRPL